MQHARGPVPGKDMDQGAKALGGLAAGCSTIPIPGMGPPAGSGDKGGCGQREQRCQCMASSQFAPAWNNDNDNGRNKEMKNVSVI